MKLWIFNVLVAGALAYLFLGESERTRVKSDLEWAKGKVETTIDNSSARPDIKPDRAAVAVEPVPPAEPEPRAASDVRSESGHATAARHAESTSQRTPQKPVSTVAVEPLEAPRAAMVAEQPMGDSVIARGEAVPTGGARPREDVREGLPPLDDPEVAHRRAVVLDIEETPPAPDRAGDAAASAPAQVTAMAARERRDALNRLAEDMELMFVDKTSR